MTAPAAPTWAPTSDDVGAVIARLIPDSSGPITGRFSASTIPTDFQVVGISAGAAVEVAAVVPDLPTALEPLARRAAAFSAAAQVADAFFPEAPEAFVRRLRDQYEQALTRLLDAAVRAASGPDVGADGRVLSVTPVGSYPDADCPVEPYAGACDLGAHAYTAHGWAWP